jgi:hypothetical protein
MFAQVETPYKLREYQAARRLRRGGMPMKQIASRLDVSPGTVHRWTRDIELTPEQRARNLGRNRPGQPGWVLTQGRIRKARAVRLGFQREGRERAGQHDPLHVAGCMLYWAEGAKSRNQLRLANSDVELVRFFVRFLKDAMGVKPEDFTMRLNVYTNNGRSIDEIERYWLDALALPRSCVRKHTLNHLPTSSSGNKKTLPYGVCTVGVKASTGLIQHIYGAIQEYVGSDEPRWLD